jgi:hypothetical protein
MDPRKVIGLALHWPAMSGPIRTPAGVIAALRGWQAYHMDGHGWSDIAYQEAVDQDGNVYVLRGLRTTPGANGDTATNATHGALLLVLAPGEEPTPAMIHAVRRRVRSHRRLFPRSHLFVGHDHIWPEPTSCPGPIVSRHIDAGTFDPEREYRP